MSSPSTISTARPRSKSPTHRLKQVVWRVSLQLGGERYRLKAMGGLTMCVLEHLQIDAEAHCVATTDATGARGYALQLESRAELPPVEQSALQVYLRRKLGELTGLNLLTVPFDVNVRYPAARLPIDEHEISSNWLRARLRVLEAEREYRVQAQRRAQAKGRAPTRLTGRVPFIDTGVNRRREAANELQRGTRS